jgi:hypothetical protein
MKTVRFSEVVNSSGKPETHLLLIAPAKDKTLQAAIKSNRVMTVYQGSGTTKTDYGTIGFEEGSSRQFLVFPKPLKSFADKRVIGIKYDLLESMPVLERGEGRTPKGRPAPKEDQRQRKPKADRAPKSTVDKAPKAIPKTEAEEKSPPPQVDEQSKERAKKPSREKLVEFPKPEPSHEVSDTSAEVEELKRRVREAMDVLEQGKQIAAFNLLKRIVEE